MRKSSVPGAHVNGSAPAEPPHDQVGALVSNPLLGAALPPPPRSLSPGTVNGEEEPAVLKAALKYCQLGWSVIPLCHPNHDGPHDKSHRCTPYRRGKAPMTQWRDYQTQRASEDQLRQWWTTYPTANVGVVMGTVSGVVAWEIADAGYQELVELNGGPLPRTVAFTTGGGGRGLIFRWPEGLAPPPSHWSAGGENLTFLGGRSCLAMPPSLHWTGESSGWEDGADPRWTSPAACTPGMLRALLNRVRDRRGAAVNEVGGEGRVHPAREDKRMRYARRFARKQTAALDARGGGYKTFMLGRTLRKRWGLTDDQVVDVLLEESRLQAARPYSEEELRCVLDLPRRARS